MTGKANCMHTNYMTPALTKLLLQAIKNVAPGRNQIKHTFILMERENRLLFSNSHFIVQVDRAWITEFLSKNFKIPITQDWWDTCSKNGTKPIYGKWEYTRFPMFPDKRVKMDWTWLNFNTTTFISDLCTRTPGRFVPVNLNLIHTKDIPMTLYTLNWSNIPGDTGPKTKEETGLLFIQTSYSEFMDAFSKYYTNLDIRTRDTKSCVSFYISHTSEFVMGIMPMYPPRKKEGLHLKRILEIAWAEFTQQLGVNDDGGIEC